MARRRRGDDVSGVLLLDKPRGITSNRALQQARGLLNAAKAGHTGTLDPLATGLLPLTFGEATKFSSDLLEADKSYEATVRLGVRTDTADAEGAVLEVRAVEVDRGQLDAVLSRFVGRITQVPPMYSALKRAGKPLYEYARAGIEVERAGREVAITCLEVVEWEGDLLRLRVDCSKGTYVRTLADDVGQALGCGAHLAALRRTRVGALRLEDAVELDALAAMPPATRGEWLLPVDALIVALARIDLSSAEAARFGQGMAVACPGDAGPGRRRVYGPQGELLGVAQCEGGVLQPRRLVAPPLLRESVQAPGAK